MSRVRRAAVAAVVLAAVAGCGGSSTPAASATPAGGSTPSPAASPLSSGVAAGPALVVAQFAFAPSPLTVSPGQVVTVTNRDGATHTVTSDQGGAFHSGDLSKGAPMTFTAPTKPGTYTFHCDYHASMHGTLVVK